MRLVTDHGNVGKALEKLEELRRTYDRIRNRRAFDQLLLCDLGAEVTALGKPVGPHNR